MELLNSIGQQFNDTSIQKYEYCNNQLCIPGNIIFNDEGRIPIQDIVPYTLPSNSYNEMVGKLGKVIRKAEEKLKFSDNVILYVFRKLRYELN